MLLGHYFSTGRILPGMGCGHHKPFAYLKDDLTRRPTQLQSRIGGGVAW